MHECADSQSIVSYVTRQSLPTISIVTADSLQDLKSTSNVVVVGYFAPDDNISHKAFTSVAEAMHEDFVFGVTNDDALAKKEQINVPGIALYKNFDEGKNAFELTHDSQAISAFVKAAGTPLVAEFYPELHFSYIDVSLENDDQPIPKTKYAL
jgi:protein disulfide-isomerase A1